MLIESHPCRFESCPRESNIVSAGWRNWQTQRPKKAPVGLARDYRSRLILRRMSSQVLRTTLLSCGFDSRSPLSSPNALTRGWSKGRTLGDMVDLQLKRRISTSRFVPTLWLSLISSSHSAASHGHWGAAPFILLAGAAVVPASLPPSCF